MQYPPLSAPRTLNAKVTPGHFIRVRDDKRPCFRSMLRVAGGQLSKAEITLRAGSAPEDKSCPRATHYPSATTGRHVSPACCELPAGNLVRLRPHFRQDLRQRAKVARVQYLRAGRQGALAALKSDPLPQNIQHHPNQCMIRNRITRSFVAYAERLGKSKDPYMIQRNARSLRCPDVIIEVGISPIPG